MTVFIHPPTRYRHWTGKAKVVKNDNPFPYLRMQMFNDVWWIEQIYDEHWTSMGLCPRGNTKWQRFWRHWHHGRLMQYPRASVLMFCITDYIRVKKAE